MNSTPLNSISVSDNYKVREVREVRLDNPFMSTSTPSSPKSFHNSYKFKNLNWEKSESKLDNGIIPLKDILFLLKFNFMFVSFFKLFNPAERNPIPLLPKLLSQRFKSRISS